MPSSSSSYSPTHEILLQNLIVAMGEPEERETRYTNLTLGSVQDATSERRVDIPSFRSGPILRGSEIMNLYPPTSDNIYNSPFCKKDFSSPHALGSHQNAHKQERECEKKWKELEEELPGLPFLNPYLDNPHNLLGGYSKNALSNEIHLGITLEPFNPLVYPSFNGGVTGGIADRNIGIVSYPTPTRFFNWNTSRNGLFPSNNNMYPLIPRNFLPFPFPSTNGSASEGYGLFTSNNNMYHSTPREVFSFPPPSTNGLASESSGVFPSNNNMYPSNPRDVFPFPPRTSRDLFPQESGLSDLDLTLRLGINNVVEIDDDDDEVQPEEGAYGSGGIDLSLSL